MISRLSELHFCNLDQVVRRIKGRVKGCWSSSTIIPTTAWFVLPLQTLVAESVLYLILQPFPHLLNAVSFKLCKRQRFFSWWMNISASELRSQIRIQSSPSVRGILWLWHNMGLVWFVHLNMHSWFTYTHKHVLYQCIYIYLYIYIHMSYHIRIHFLGELLRHMASPQKVVWWGNLY